jgi:hypothetical protein
MSTLPRTELFHRPGPDATLQYLWSRLQNRDLSETEALAVLGALHHELGQSKAQEPKVYSSYSHFMASLDHEMPTVHHYVVAAWTENRYARKRQVLSTPTVEPVDDIPEPSPDEEATPTTPTASVPVSASRVGIAAGAAEEDEADSPEAGQDVNADELERAEAEQAGMETEEGNDSDAEPSGHGPVAEGEDSGEEGHEWPAEEDPETQLEEPLDGFGEEEAPPAVE